MSLFVGEGFKVNDLNNQPWPRERKGYHPQRLLISAHVGVGQHWEGSRARQRLPQGGGLAQKGGQEAPGLGLWGRFMGDGGVGMEDVFFLREFSRFQTPGLGPQCSPNSPP